MNKMILIFNHLPLIDLQPVSTNPHHSHSHLAGPYFSYFVCGGPSVQTPLHLC